MYKARGSRLPFQKGLLYNSSVAKRLPPEIRDFFVKMGRRGGKIGGRKRVANMTPEQLSEANRRAVQARWAKAKGAAQ
jgi:hypothetical protein